MRCPRCGNEVNQDEAFCGQCGTPINPPTSAANAILPHSGSMPAVYPLNAPIPYSPIRALSPSQKLPAFPASQPSFGMSNPNQQTGFYHEPTQALSLPSSAHSPVESPQQHFSSGSIPTVYPGQPPFPAQGQTPFQARPYRTPNSYPAPYNTPHVQSYTANNKYTRTINQPPPKQQHSAIILIICLCVAVAIVSVAGVVTFSLTRGTPDTAALAPTSVPMLTPSPTSMPTPTSPPSPTVLPTPIADQGFNWCTTSCTSYGFAIEYPTRWSQSTPSTAPGTQFNDPSQADSIVVLKAPGQVTNAETASDVLNSDLQTNFAAKTGYLPPPTTQTATIGGETWLTGIAYYQNDTQTERIQVFAIVHEQKIYIIELQALDTQFDTMNRTTYSLMLSKFQFLPQGRN